MQVEKTSLEGVLLVKPDVFEDFRGQYVRTYAESQYRDLGIGTRFVEDDISLSRRSVLRGIHGDAKTWKLVSCLYGSFYLVVVNCDEQSPSFGKWLSFTLSDRNRHQVLIPPQHGNGHVVLSDCAVFHYKQSEYYDPSRQFTYRWDDPRLNIWWPIKNPIVSRRDEAGRFVD
jgi:dTDP-4-dehydrorhamnose 3,5-epimerase